MAKKRLFGPVFFAIILILGSLYQLPGLSMNSYNFLFQPLSQRVIAIRFIISIVFICLGLISGIGLFFQKNIFRWMSLAIGIFIVYNYMIELPLVVFKNLKFYVDQLILNSGLPYVTKTYIRFWTPIIISALIEFLVGVSLIIYFTRRKVKEQFN